MTTPATEIALQGTALIEASAGTGKTWTLTGIILRLIVESGRLPEEIVATTFTRAAAAEMRRRIHARLLDFHLLLSALLRLCAKTPTLAPAPGALNAYTAQFAQAALCKENEAYLSACGIELSRLTTVAKDAVNIYLINTIDAQGFDGLILAYRRTIIGVNDIDRFFVGTLDSLCQRWLHEFALDTGANKAAVNEDSTVIEHFIHDFLRDYYQQRYKTDPQLFVPFYRQNARESSAYIEAAKSILNYGDAAIDPVCAPEPVFSAVDEQAINSALALLEQGYQAGFLRKNTNLVKYRQMLPELAANCRLYQKPQGKAAQLLVAVEALLNRGTGLNAKADDKYKRALQNHPLLTALIRWQQPLQQLLTQSLAAAVNYSRQHLPAALAQQNETLYSELSACLNRALAHSSGQRLARYIAHHYPVLLIDESQDLNRIQSNIIEQIYLNPPTEQGFLLPVGDPKQAIYRFRGSDVANYERLKQQIPAAKHYALQHNYRSSPALIAALNESYAGCLKQGQAEMGQDICYLPMYAAKPQGNICHTDGSAVKQPLIWLDNPSAGEEIPNIVGLIQTLLSPQSSYRKRDKQGQLQLIRPGDILLIVRSNTKLRELETALQQVHIPTERKSDSSIFAGEVAREIGCLLTAILTPGDNRTLHRVLAGKLYRFSDDELRRLTENDACPETAVLASFRRALEQAQEQWQQYGLLSALQDLLRGNENTRNSVWETLAAQPAPAKYRDLLDLRQLQQIIAQYAPHMRPQTFTDWWHRHCQDPPAAEWAKIRPLPVCDAVRLMTIHGAKGLQAPVVILAGLGQPRQQQQTLNLHIYHDEAGNPRIHPGVPAAAEIADKITREENEEIARLVYVAVTRSEDLLFICNRRNKKGQDTILAPAAALRQHSGAHSLVLPEPSFQAAETEQTALFPRPALNPVCLPPAEPVPVRYGWGKTSFSALLRSLPTSEYSHVVYTDSAAELAGERKQEPTPAPYRFSFARGTTAGSFLHEVLEKIRPDLFLKRRELPFAAQYSNRFLSRLLHKYRLASEDAPCPEHDLQALIQWLEDILHTPLSGNTSLAQLTPGQSQHEMSFNLAVLLQHHDQKRIAALNALFQHWGKPLNLPVPGTENRYLRGEIDLVYCAAGRYYLVDYKSNHLGNTAAAYTPQAMQEAMNHHCYWLQAAIYQLALHRLLKVRLPDYHPDTHLGMPQYLFLRGICQDEPANGHYQVEIPTEIVLTLDDILRRA